MEHLKIGNVPSPASFRLRTSCVPPPAYDSPPHGTHSSLRLGVDVHSHAQLKSIVDILPIAWADYPLPPSLHQPLPPPLPPPCPPLLPELVSSDSSREEGHDYSGRCSDAAGGGNEVEGQRPLDEGLWEGERPRDEASGPSDGVGEVGGGDEEVETQRQAQRDGYGKDENPVPIYKFFSIWLPPDRGRYIAPTVFPLDDRELLGLRGYGQGVADWEDQEEDSDSEEESGGSSSSDGGRLPLSHPVVDELFIVSIAKNCPSLKTLHLDANNRSHGECCFKERPMAALVYGCTALTDLSLTTGAANFYMWVNHSAVRVLSGCNQLRNLSLCGFWPAASDALQDGSCPLLSSLSLAESSLLRRDQDEKSLSPSFFCFQSTRRRTLTSLCVTDSLYFADEQLEAAVVECVCLRKVDVSGTRVSDWGIIAAVRACSDLQTLVASRCRFVTDSSVSVVAAEGGRQLRELCFDETGVTHYALSFLAGGTCTLGLVKLLLYGSQVSGEACAYPRLPSLRSLEVLLQRHQHLQEVGLRIFDPFVDQETVERMELMWGRAVLSKRLSHLYFCRRRDPGLENKKEGPRLLTLKEPRLPAWQSCGPFLRSLSPVGPSLHHLHLFSDPRALFGDFEEEFLAFLSTCPSLLSLRLTGISQVSAAILYRLGDLCPSLEHLAIAGCQIPFPRGFGHLRVTSPRLQSFEYFPGYYRAVLLGEAEDRIRYIRRTG
ncbi:hypothetical protein CBR_g400 [Chara braunii]|uniref:COI1 F-box domain-containing protein n=1 Tax=Chara braunii TaxID=69332 RepID=A0A388JQG5_CHABU|nr:hypothetical protein CBR_g400 [Chara braunii]|eukprot:GBG60069.1 hypothetical protein CBR_g400 [Chara braunii]